MGVEDSDERIMLDLLGPDSDRDWIADADAVSVELHEVYDLPLLDKTGITTLASGLEGLELCCRPYLQVPPFDKTREQKMLREVQKHADALRELIDPNTDFGRRFLFASERVAATNEHTSRFVTGRTSAFRGGNSPTYAIGPRLEFVSIAAAEELARLSSTEQRRRSYDLKTEVMGRDLLNIYGEVYPNERIGSYNDYTGEVDGPRHRFVQMCGTFLGYPSESMANIAKMARVMLKRGDE